MSNAGNSNVIAAGVSAKSYGTSEYKGGAIGDPARSAAANKSSEAKQRSADHKGTALSDPAATSKLPQDRVTLSREAQQLSKSYPVEYKGTAFGDPAATPKPMVNTSA
ncbi:hypothetical protein CCP3SC1AL1_1160004 [Gammaproteobacteria bacterium]